MATITKTIGTTGRDYATIQLWDDDLDNASIYASGDIAVGTIYNDSEFTAGATIDGGGTIGLASRKLTVASASRHDGTAGSGARILNNQGGIVIGIGNTTLEWLEIYATGKSTAATPNGISAGANIDYITIQNCIVHGYSARNTFNGARGIIVSNSGSDHIIIQNNIVYDIKQTNASATVHPIGISLTGNVNTNQILNNTVHSITSTAAGTIGIVAGANVLVKNNISTDSDTCFSGGTQTTNLSSDATATGQASKTSANQFVDNTPATADLHLKAGADAINNGTDLGTTPTGVNIDIDGRDRDAQGDTWDIGCDEYVATISTNLKSYNTNLKANIKSINTNLIANVKTLNTNA
jgi:hypothetical protein